MSPPSVSEAPPASFHAEHEARAHILPTAPLTPPRVEIVVPADPHGPGLLNRVVAAERELIERGVAALEGGRETEAYALFKRATELHPRAPKTWFWRAKTAETLDEVVDCLRRAIALDPTNTQIAANLEWATQRKEQARAARREDQPATRRPTPAPRRPARRGRVWRMARTSRELARATAALAAFVVAAAWLLAALPPELRASLVAASGLHALPLPTTSPITDVVHVTLAGGYDLSSAVPFGIGFLALFVGLGLLGGDRWTRLWAPAVGVASAWAWSSTPAAAVSPYLLPACCAVVLGGALCGEWPTLRLPTRDRRRAVL